MRRACSAAAPARVVPGDAPEPRDPRDDLGVEPAEEVRAPARREVLAVPLVDDADDLLGLVEVDDDDRLDHLVRARA